MSQAEIRAELRAWADHDLVVEIPAETLVTLMDHMDMDAADRSAYFLLEWIGQWTEVES